MFSAENMFTSEEEAWCKLAKFRQIPFHYKAVQELHFFPEVFPVPPPFLTYPICSMSPTDRGFSCGYTTCKIRKNSIKY